MPCSLHSLSVHGASPLKKLLRMARFGERCTSAFFIVLITEPTLSGVEKLIIPPMRYVSALRDLARVVAGSWLWVPLVPWENSTAGMAEGVFPAPESCGPCVAPLPLEGWHRHVSCEAGRSIFHPCSGERLRWLDEQNPG